MSDRTNILLGATIPEEWIERFDTLAKERGRSRTDIILEALAQYLGIEGNQVVLKSEVERIKSQLTALQDRVAKTEGYGQQLAVMMSKLQQLERIVVSNDSSKEDSDVATAQSSTPESASVKSLDRDSFASLDEDDLDDDDLYDEPDEILADFLPPRYSS